jgi:hypothetical protein
VCSAGRAARSRLKSSSLSLTAAVSLSPLSKAGFNFTLLTRGETVMRSLSPSAALYVSLHPSFDPFLRKKKKGFVSLKIYQCSNTSIFIMSDCFT